MFLADLHIHSTFSDGKLTIPEIVDLYGSCGFGAIAITDHLREAGTLFGRAARYLEKTLTLSTFPLYQAILSSEAERAWKQYRMVLIPGVEFCKDSFFHHRAAHILAIGLTHFLPAKLSVVDLARNIRGLGALAVAAHPVSIRRLSHQTHYLWDQREELAAEFDAWEVASGPYLFTEVANTRLPKLANSNFHCLKHINSWKTAFECEKHPESILEAIRKQELKFKFYYREKGHDLMDWVDASTLGHGDRSSGIRDLVNY